MTSSEWRERRSKSRDSSKWSDTAITRRDRQHTHEPVGIPRPGATVGKNKKKDTKRWCRGKVGQEHDYSIRRDMSYSWLTRTFRIEQCSRCGKRRWS